MTRLAIAVAVLISLAAGQLNAQGAVVGFVGLSAALGALIGSGRGRWERIR